MTRNELEMIRKTRGVNCRRLGRVKYTGGVEPAYGTITGAEGGYVMIRMDGERNSHPHHPTWELEYLDERDQAE